MIQQYLSIKEKYADAILFYRMGDFYEMFFEDAEIASGILEITLTSRNKKDANAIPMCGVPVKAARGYIARLIENGKKVAVCEQVEDPAEAKGIVKREVVRLVTPGMIVEDDLLDEKSNNYILALARKGDRFGISWLDISTGTFRICETGKISAVLDEVRRVAPSEILLPNALRESDFLSGLGNGEYLEKSVTFLEDRFFGHAEGRKTLVEQFQTLSLEGFGCEELKAGTGAAGALLHYVRETQKQAVEHITGISVHRLSGFMMVDDLSCRNLELFKNLHSGTRRGTLVSTVDGTRTAMGGRLLKRWIRYPLASIRKINARLDAVDEGKREAEISRTLREHLKAVRDLERLGSKITMGYSNAKDLIALKLSLQRLPDILSLTAQLKSGLFKWKGKTAPLDALAELIENAIREDAPPTINEGGIIREGYNDELDELITVSRDGKSWLAKLEAKEKAETGINTLKVKYNKVFGYYIEISKSQTASAPDHYIRKQTLVNAERYITEELKTFESKVLNARDQRSGLEYQLFDAVRKEVVKNNERIRDMANYLARLDCILGLAEVAEQNGYSRPEIHTNGDIRIKAGRHPVIETMITGERFVPNTIKMDNDKRQVLVITGPNMAGKSTILRQVALTVIMAQMGSFVPANEASVSVCDRIFTRVGALDNLSQGQSTFMVEMQETANILNSATSKSLVVMDEIGRGTSTFDGMSIAWAVAEYLHDLNGRGVKTLFATHYHELTELSQTKQRVKNYNIAVKEFNDEIIFLRKLVEGGTNRSYGIQVARLAGVPVKVVKRAKKVLADVEKRKGGALDVFFNAGEPVQTGRVAEENSGLIEEIQNLDISKMTPLDAMNRLNELHEKTKMFTN